MADGKADGNNADSSRFGTSWDLSRKVPAGFRKLGDAKGRPHISSERYAPADVSSELGLLKHLAGTWEGEGFNLIARPAFNFGTDLFLQLNRTRETLKFDPIGSPIPNRGFEQADITLHGLTYLQKINDLSTGSALHIEPGIWVRQPNTAAPAEIAPAGAEIIARMGSIPHGNAILAQGLAQRFTGPPTLQVPGNPFHGSNFYSFNSTPIGAPPTVPATAPPVFSATGSSQAGTAAVNGITVFDEYNLSVPVSPVNTRTSPVPPGITQAIVNDPIILLQDVVNSQVNDGYTFEGTVLNIATVQEIDFHLVKDSPLAGPTVATTVPEFNGGPENILFLIDDRTTPPNGNAQTAIIYATFWIERVTHKKHGHSFMQLQYAQMVTLNFPIRSLLNNGAFVNLGWPHITVATLKKGFG
jgi:hypothetical protein